MKGIEQNITSVISNNLSWKCQRFTSSGYRDIGSMSRKLGFLEKNQFIRIQTNSETYFMNVQ